MSNIPLPKPREYKQKLNVNKNHGLWGFFPAADKPIWTPDEMGQHGRAWKVEELRKKSWDDLHSLWWVCCKERNMLATAQADLAKLNLGFGETEIRNRDGEVRQHIETHEPLVYRR